MREQIEALKDHADAFPHLIQIGGAIVGSEAVYLNLAFADGFQRVHAAQKSAFPGTGRADNTHDFLRLNVAADAAQNVAVAEALV